MYKKKYVFPQLTIIEVRHISCLATSEKLPVSETQVTSNANVFARESSIWDFEDEKNEE